MGLAPLSFHELQAWQSGTGLALSAWECLALRKLSSEYVDQLHRSRSRDEPAPYQTEDLPKQRAAVHNFFKLLAKRMNGNERPRKAKRKGHV